MAKRRTIGVAVAAAVLGGLGAFGAGTAYAITTTPAPATSTDAGSRPGGHGKSEMLRHCTEQLPEERREKARKHMQEMMSGGMRSMMSGHGSPGGSIMGDDSAGGQRGDS